MIEYPRYVFNLKILRAIQERGRTREGRTGGNQDHPLPWVALFVLGITL